MISGKPDTQRCVRPVWEGGEASPFRRISRTLPHDTTLFLGGKEKTTLKELAEVLGKETIDLYNTSDTRGTSQSYGLNYQKTGKDMPYLFVKSWLPNTKINGTGTRSASNSANHVFFISFHLVQFYMSEK